MKEGLDALTKLVKVVMAYRPDRKKGKPSAKPVQSPSTRAKK